MITQSTVSVIQLSVSPGSPHHMVLHAQTIQENKQTSVITQINIKEQWMNLVTESANSCHTKPKRFDCATIDCAVLATFPLSLD